MFKKSLLKKIKGPKNLKKLPITQLKKLSEEIRTVLIKTVAKNGGHLAPNLGTVELTIALHYSYNSPEDKIVWDVGHQAYTHKLLTGRYEKFSTLRLKDGLSGYLKREESEHDCYGAGHVGTAVSAALGFAQARDLKKEKNHVVAIIGDGSLTNGLTFEGINNVGSTETDLTVILNDNKFSISKNTGGIANYLEKLSSIHMNGEPHTDIESIFHSLGFKYFGPIDGHDIKQLIDVFNLAQETPGPKLIHIETKKGLGYYYSEHNPPAFHSTSPFILESGKTSKDTKKLTYTKVFGNTLIKLAKKDKKIIAITAAMPAGTGIDKFALEFPERFFDTGIAEEHAVVFASALALEGFKPVVAIYSTFLQRSYDQILHDVALQKIPVIFAIDRAGLVGSDGPTHHGAFDLSYLRNIPHMIILAPKDENELQHMLYTATQYTEGPIAIRYPRGTGIGSAMNRTLEKLEIGKAEKLRRGNNAAILAIGSMVYPAIEASNLLKKNDIHATVYNARSVKPIDSEMVKNAAKTGKIITVEENILDGGFGSAILEELQKQNIQDTQVVRIGIEDFIEHGEINELREKYGLTANGICKKVLEII
ncbi:MAG: 1-deoxy-D-xylulose-5-phosphate synthase [Patescibacteria group bacterium]|jgi:1-deoxy-D-xylulose-5-phosphate synthase